MVIPSILDLPQEILLNIAEPLSLAGLNALSRTCRMLRHISEPLIYCSIRMKWHHKYTDPPIKLLIRTFLERPDLPRHVRRLVLHGRPRSEWWKLPFPDFSCLPTSVALQQDKLAAATSSKGILPELAAIWPCEIDAGNPDAAVALLIATLPNLIELCIDRNWALQTQFTGHVVRAAVLRLCEREEAVQVTGECREGILESLRQVCLFQREGNDTHRSPNDINNILCLFYLPSVQHIAAPVGNPTRFSWPFPTPPNPKSLTSLELTRVRECFLVDLLSCLNNLQKLRYKVYYRTDVDTHIRDNIVDLDLMVAAFLKHKDTLIELEIEAMTESAISNSEIDSPDIYLRGSLKQLSQLYKVKKIEVPWNFLAGVWEIAPAGTITSSLPPDVEHLTLGYGIDVPSYHEFGWENQEIIDYFKDELESGGLVSLKRLRCICLSIYANGSGILPQFRTELDNLSRRLNVRLTMLGENGSGEKFAPSYESSTG